MRMIRQTVGGECSVDTFGTNVALIDDSSKAEPVWHKLAIWIRSAAGRPAYSKLITRDLRQFRRTIGKDKGSGMSMG
jgi:hypothetical protein